MFMPPQLLRITLAIALYSVFGTFVHWHDIASSDKQIYGLLWKSELFFFLYPTRFFCKGFCSAAFIAGSVTADSTVNLCLLWDGAVGVSNRAMCSLLQVLRPWSCLFYYKETLLIRMKSLLYRFEVKYTTPANPFPTYCYIMPAMRLTNTQSVICTKALPLVLI